MHILEMSQQKLAFFYCKNLQEFKGYKVSINEENNKYILNNIEYDGAPDVPFGYIIFIEDEKIIWTHGEFYAEPCDLSALVTNEEFASVKEYANSSIQSGTLGTINGESIENGNNITLDMSLYKLVTALPSENISDNKIYIVPVAKANNETEFAEYIWTGTKWDQLGSHKLTVDLSAYMKTADADKKYLPKSLGGGSSSSSGSQLSISTTGAFNNYGNNGQAFNAVRDVSGTNKYLGETGSKYPLDAASFGVKDNGTTAFSHKKYDTFNKDTGAATGARNTAVLVFSGNSGLLYAKNTGTASDVTDDMYKYVGVIDSPDERQRVYSTKQVDTIISPLIARISELESKIETLTSAMTSTTTVGTEPPTVTEPPSDGNDDIVQ